MATDKDFELVVPGGNVISAITVQVVLAPPNARVRLHGRNKSGIPVHIEIYGATDKISLPFSNGHVETEYLSPVDHCEIILLGWLDRRDDVFD